MEDTYWHTVWEHPVEPQAPLGRRLGSLFSVPIYARARFLWLLGLAALALIACLIVGGAVPGDLPFIGGQSVQAFGIGGVLGGMAGLILHESGHALAARARSQTVCHVMLSTKVGVIIGRRGEPFTAQDMAVIVLAGPLTNVLAALLAAVGAVLIRGSVGFGCAVASIINLMFLLDLLPAYSHGPHGHRIPNDGALLLQTLRSARRGHQNPLSR